MLSLQEGTFVVLDDHGLVREAKFLQKLANGRGGDFRRGSVESDFHEMKK